MSVEIVTEAAKFLFRDNINGIFVAVWMKTSTKCLHYVFAGPSEATAADPLHWQRQVGRGHGHLSQAQVCTLIRKYTL